MSAELVAGVSRRRFLQALGLATGGAAALLLRPGAPLYESLVGLFRRRRLAAAELNRELLAPLEGDTLAVTTSDGASVSLRVEQVTPLEAYQSPGAHGEVFSVVMSGDEAVTLGQDTYDFEHGGIGSFPMFMVPVGLPGRGRQLYEAVFNRIR